MTGRQAGYCAGYPVPGYANPIPGRGWWFGPFGWWGRGFGIGRGRGWRHWYWVTGLPGWARFGFPPSAVYPYPPAAYYPYYPELTPGQEMEMLKEEATFLKQSLQDVESRISALEKVMTKKEE
jgi:hypothetical protein